VSDLLPDFKENQIVQQAVGQIHPMMAVLAGSFRHGIRVAKNRLTNTHCVVDCASTIPAKPMSSDMLKSAGYFFYGGCHAV